MTVNIKDILLDGLRKSEVMNEFVDKLPDDVRPSEISITLKYKHESPNEQWIQQEDKNGEE